MTEEKSTDYDEQGNKKRTKKKKKKKKPGAPKRTWPPSTMGQPKRTVEVIEGVLDDEDFIEDYNGSDAELRDSFLGVKGRCILHDYKNFDIVEDIPAEWMHSMCLGCVRQLFELTFDVGQKRFRHCSYRRLDVKLLDTLLLQQHVCSEMSRKTRAIQYKNMKAEELKYLILVFFPLIIETIPVGRQERVLWTMLAFLLRTFTNPAEEVAQISENHLRHTCDRFIRLFHGAFGTVNCVYNTHLIHHLWDIRKAGIFTATSAFPFEGFFSFLRRAFAPGTINSGGQIMHKAYMRVAASHTCSKTLKFTTKVTSKTRDDLVYQFCDGRYHFFRLIEVGSKLLRCHEYCCIRNEDEPTGLVLSRVGVYISGGLDTSEECVLRRSQVSGKALLVPGQNGRTLLVSLPKSVLFE